MLKASVIGNLGADAVVRHTNGNNAIGFSVAHNEKYKDKDGNAHERTIWVNCTIWRERETSLVNYLKKGQMVYLEGTPSVSVYRNRDGQPTADFSLRVTKLELLGGRSDREEQPTAAQQPVQATTAQTPVSPQPVQQTVPATHNAQTQAPPQQPVQQVTPVSDLETPDWAR